MELRLTYEGLLLSDKECQSRTDHKHSIRRQFHPQLKRFWGIHPWLVFLSTHGIDARPVDPTNRSALEMIADRFKRENGYRFAPLVREELMLLCHLDILYLRRQKPGTIIANSDIDNRLKVLFDALKAPKEGSKEIPSTKPAPDEELFFVLVEDDTLITQVSVETDWLLADIPNKSYDDNDARVVITVRIQPYYSTLGVIKGNDGFA